MLFLSIFLGMVGPGFIYVGKKHQNFKLIFWGVAMTIASYFVFSF